MMIFRRFLMIVSLFLASFTHLYGVKKPTLYITNSNFQISPSINSSFSVFDLSVDPLDPTLVTTLSTQGREARAILVAPQETALYILNQSSNTLAVFDISNDPQAPVPKSLLSTNSRPNSMAIDVTGTALYVGHSSSSTIRVFNISDPLNPISAGSFSLSTPANYVEVDPRGTYLYIGNFFSNLIFAYDITNPLSPVSVGIPVTTGFSVNNVVKMLANSQGSVLYVADNSSTAGNNYISAFNILNTPKVAGLASNSLTSGANSYGLAIDNTGQALYVANQDTNNFSVFNISNPLIPGTPSVVSSGVSSAPRGLTVYPTANVLYVANSGTSDMAIFDLTDPQVPSFAALAPVPGISSLSSRPEQIAILVHADPLPPEDVRMVMRKDCCSSERGAKVALVWNPSPSLTTIVEYRIYKNGELIAKVPSSERTFIECGICGNQFYQMSSVDDQGLESEKVNAQFIQ